MRSGWRLSPVLKCRRTDLMICLLLAYSLFLVLKFNGCCDFTGRYGIERIFCRGTHPNSWVLMIDGDLGTTWGDTELQHPSETIVFRFRKARPIARLGFTNASQMPTVPIKVLGSLYGDRWTEFKGEWSGNDKEQFLQNGEGGIFRFIKFEYAAEQAGRWPITEVWFNE